MSKPSKNHKTSKTPKPNKSTTSFRIPEGESHVRDLINLVSEATGQTPSHWVYGTIVKRLTEAGLLDQNRQPVEEKIAEVRAMLPPGADMPRK